MAIEFHTADVFTDRAYGGNQLAVIPDAVGLSTGQMSNITREFNFSETVFVLPPDNPANACRLRIFTPGAELPFAGHPTVGAAFVLASIGVIQMPTDETRVTFEEGVGPVPILIRSHNGIPVFTQLTAAKLPEQGSATYDSDTIAGVLSLEADDLDVNDVDRIESWSAGVPFLFVPVKSREALARARIHIERWERALKDSWAPEVFVFVGDDEAPSQHGVANGNGVIRARMFAPTLGIAEDPATGAAVTAFGGYLSSRSSCRDGTLLYTIHQGVEMGRPSKLELEVDTANGSATAVRVGGASVMMSSGQLTPMAQMVTKRHR